MTVPRCKGRVVRHSRLFRYNESGLTSKAMNKIFTKAKRRALRLAKRARSRKFKSATNSKHRFLGYHKVTTKVPWVSVCDGSCFYSPVTGEAIWHTVEPPPIVTYRWESVITPVSNTDRPVSCEG